MIDRVAAWIDSPACSERHFRYSDPTMRYTCLHQAVRNDWPLEIVRRVAKGYPQAALHSYCDVDPRSMIPIHYARSEEIAEFLYLYDPYTMRVTDRRSGYTPLHAFAKKGFVVAAAIRADPSLCLIRDRRDRTPLQTLFLNSHNCDSDNDFLDAVEVYLTACPRSLHEDTVVAIELFQVIERLWGEDAHHQQLYRIARLVVHEERLACGPLQEAIRTGVPTDLCLELGRTVTPESLLTGHGGLEMAFMGSPYDAAIEQGRLDVLEGFLRLSPEILFANVNDSMLVLDLCAKRYGSADVMRAVANVVPDCMYRIGESGETVLHRLCLSGEIEGARAVMEAGPEALRRVDKDGNLPIHRLCLYYASALARVSPGTDGSRVSATEGVPPAETLLLDMLEAYPDAILHKSRQTEDCLLHLAIRYGVRDSTLRRLLHAWPEAAGWASNGQLLPLHLHLSLDRRRRLKPADAESFEFLRELLLAYPLALRRPTREGIMPFQQAAENDCSINIIFCLLQEGPDVLASVRR